MTRQTTSFSFHSFLSWITLLAPLLLLRSSSDAFSISSSPSSAAALRVGNTIPSFQKRPFSSSNPRNILHAVHDILKPSSSSSSSTTSLSMYNLPPSGGGGGGGGKNEIADIAKGAFSLLLVVGFFISPLGGLVLGIFNSFLVLAIALPLVATVSFKVWQSLNTIQGDCPNCGAPVTVIKNKSSASGVDDAPPAPSICFNCGASLQANDGNTEINNVSGRKSIDDLNSPMGGSIFDIFSGGGGDVPTDPFSSTRTSTTTTTSTSTASSNKRDNKVGIDKSNVIDVDVLDDDKPFQ